MNEPKFKILVLEDAKDTQMIIKSTLSDIYELVLVEKISGVDDQKINQNFDLFVLDILLPDGESWSVCEKIRKADPNVPILFLTSKEDITDKLKAFSLGADDYLTKPFNPLELKIRIEAKLKLKKPTSKKLLVGPVELNSMSKKVYLNHDNKKRLLDLTKTEFQLLEYFMKNNSNVLSREQILNKVWGNSHVFDRTVDAHISKLRKKLSPYSNMIDSVHGEGYRFEYLGAHSRAS